MARTAARNDEAARRQAANVALGWRLAGVALVMFLLALWKFRPL